nr:hypothetical protein [Candidatus Sigynarchaeota archaeon]
MDDGPELPENRMEQMDDDWYDEELEALCEGIDMGDGEEYESAGGREREDWYDEELEALCEGIDMGDDVMEDPWEEKQEDMIEEGNGGGGGVESQWWDYSGGDDFGRVGLPNREFTFTRRWERRDTPDEGWVEYYAETASARNEKVGAAHERTFIFARGETGEGDKVAGVGRTDGAEFSAWVWGDEGWFEEVYVRAERSSVVENWEISRPVDASLMWFPPGADIKGELRITRDPRLKDLKAFGKSTEFWTDSDGYPTVRSTRWLILQRDGREGKDDEFRSGPGRSSVVMVMRVDVLQFRPGREGVVNRESFLTTFSPLEGARRGARCSLESSEECGGGGKETAGQWWMRVLLGGKGDGGHINDYRFKGEFTELVYLPPDASETSIGDEKTRVAAVGCEDGVRSEENITDGFDEASTGKTEEGTSQRRDSGDVVEGVADASNFTEADETATGYEEAAIPEVFKEGKETGGDVEYDAEARGRASEEKGWESAPVELGSDGRVSVGSVLRIVGEGVFRAGSEEEYWRRLRKRGIELDYKKLSEMLLIRRELPKGVYLALKSLAEEDEKENQEGYSDETSWIDSNTELTPVEEKKRKNDSSIESEQLEQQEREEPSLEDLFVIISNVVRGVTYSVSRRGVQKLLKKAVRRCGGEKGLVEELRRKSGIGPKLLYESLKGGEISLRLFGAILKLAEETQKTEEKVREVVEKTLKLIKQLGLKLPQGEEGDALSTAPEKGEEDPARELRRRGYAYLGQKIGEHMSGEGLLDDWILDLITACEQPPITRKEGFEEILEKLRRIWKKLGIDADAAIAPLIEEAYGELERSELLILLYNPRREPLGMRGMAVSYIDVLEILVEAARRAGSVEKFLEIFREKTGRTVSPSLLDYMLATRRLDKDVLKVALEYAYETEENMKERLRLLQKNTDYILGRLLEEARFLSRLEFLLEPLEELNRRLKQHGRKVFLGTQTWEIEQRKEVIPATVQQVTDTIGVTESIGLERVEKSEAEGWKDVVSSVVSFGEEKPGGASPSTGGKLFAVGAYTDVEKLWNAILSDPNTVTIFEYMNPDWRETGGIAPAGPIINLMQANWGNYYGYESSRYLFNIFTIIENCLRRSFFPVSFGDVFTRSTLNYYIGQHQRGLATLAELRPEFGDSLCVYIFDHASAFVDPTTGIIFILDDFEKPIGFWSFGITVQTSFVRYGDRDGGYINQTFLIHNDPGTCWDRLMWLKQVDSRGNPIVTEDRLIRLGWGYYLGDTFVSCIDDKTGELTKIVLWDMGVNPNRDAQQNVRPQPVKVIDLKEIGTKLDCQKFTTGKYVWSERGDYRFTPTGEAVIWGQRTRSGDKIVLSLLRSNINYMLPECTEITDPYRIWPNPNRTPDKRDWHNLMLDEAFCGLMAIAGVHPALQSSFITALSRLKEPERSLTTMKYISYMCDGWGLSPKPVSFDEVKNVIEKTFVKRSFRAFLEHGRHIKTGEADKQKMVGSDRLALEMILGSGVAMIDPCSSGYPSAREVPVLFSYGMEPVTYDQTTHPATASPLVRGSMPLFKVPIEEFTDENGKLLLPDSIEPDEIKIDGKSVKCVLCMRDIVATEQMGGIPVVFVPIFKKDAEVSHQSNPTELIKRVLGTKSDAPITTVMEKFWSSIDKYAVFTFKDGKHIPLRKLGKSTHDAHIYTESEYTPMDFNEISGMLTILAHACSRWATHSSRYPGISQRNALSPKYFFEELCGYLVDKPLEFLGLFRLFEGPSVLAELRKFKPLRHLTNAAYLGWFAMRRHLDDTTKWHPEFKELSKLWKTLKLDEQIPTSIDLYILLLSFTGVQRATSSRQEYLPIEVKQ